MDIAKIRKKLKKGGEKKSGGKRKSPERRSQPEESFVQVNEPTEGTPVEHVPVEHVTTPTDEIQSVEEFFDDPYADEYEDAVHKTEILAFKVSGQEYAFRVSEVQEILRSQPITPVPGANRYILGITSLRGTIIPVVDLSRRLLVNEVQEYEGKAKILVAAGPRGAIGVILESAVNVLAVPEEDVGDVPESLSAEEARFLDGSVRVGSRRIVFLINTERLFDFSGEMEAR